MQPNSKYLTNVGTIKEYNDSYYKLTQLFISRNHGFESERKFVAKGGAGNEEKLDNSISRTKATVFEISICNPWEYFVTFTLNKDKHDRYDLKDYIKRLGYFLQNYNRNHQVSIDYILIPEKHKDGAWHMHGFFMGIPITHLQAFKLDMSLPRDIRERLKMGKTVYNWETYQRSFGWCCIEQIENPEAVSKYITKYITKDLSRSVTDLNAKMYYCTKNLKRSTIVYRDFLARSIDCPDYSNDYVSAKVCSTYEEAYAYFTQGG
ncbi:MAG: hypothetical protein RR444_03760 [Oscillospiraceae bacterium]